MELQLKPLLPRFSSLIAISAALALQVPALHAQDTPVSEEDEEESGDVGVIAPEAGETIVVEGTRVRGQLIVDEPPVAEFDEDDIAAFGAGSIEDVLAAIEPATGSGARGGRGGGRPVFLINGMRVSSWREFRSYPPESIRKIEVFPEEVAQRFGYSADQRVVNILLKPNFQAVTAEVEYAQPDRGGYSENEQELTYLRIGENGRLNFNFEVEDGSMLTEAERGLTVNSDPGEARFRSLIADTWGAEATANYARAFIDSGTSLSINGTYERSETRSISGLALNDATPLERRGASDSFSVGGSVNKPFGDWNATFTTDANRTLSETEIDRFDSSGFDVARSRTWTIDNAATLTGYPIELPAGEVSTTFDVGIDWTQISSDDTRTDNEVTLSRRRVNGGVNVSIPVAERDGFLGAVGDISMNLNAGVENLSDFGTLADWSAGVNWRPTDSLAFSATRIFREVAPSLTNLGNPRIDEFNQSVFDYATGDSVLATVITGGNPDLQAETQSDWKFSANWELPFWENTRLQADYGINRSRDVTSTPGFSAAFEQAFPDRVTRNDAGELLAIDRRPLTLYETRSRILSFGINTRGEIGKAPEATDGGGDRGEPTRGSRQAGEGAQTRPAGGRFNPERMAAMRETFCKMPEGQTPDLSGIPEQFRARLTDENGNPDPEKIAQARERFCGEEAEERARQFEMMRTAICAEPPQLDGLPEEILARLRNEAGGIDPEKVAQMRGRLCATGDAATGSEGGGEARSRGGPRGGGMRLGRGGGGDSEDRRARYFVSLNHNIVLENEVLLSENGPLFDQLGGEVLGGGAIAQHTARFQGGLFWQGYGLRLSGNYTGEAEIEGSDALGSSDLFFNDLVTFDARVFADLGQIFDKEDGWMKNLRLSLVADNLFDARRRVVDEDGNVPEAYEPFRIDARGRYLGIDLRKAF